MTWEQSSQQHSPQLYSEIKTSQIFLQVFRATQNHVNFFSNFQNLNTPFTKAILYLRSGYNPVPT